VCAYGVACLVGTCVSLLVIPPDLLALLKVNAPIAKREAYARHVSLSIDNGLHASSKFAVDN